MKKLLIAIAIFIPLFLSAQEPIKGNAVLENVLVFSSGAEMTHKAKINLPAGSSEVVINNIANRLDEKSVQIGANANVTILSVNFAQNYLNVEEKSPEYLRLEDSIKLVDRAMAQLSILKQSEQSVLDVIDKNSAIGGSNSGVNVTELLKFADYVKNKKLEVRTNIVKIDEQILQQTERRGKLQKQMSELQPNSKQNSGQLVLQVMAKNAQATDFSISYVALNAGWVPFYDLRADNTTKPLKISYKANVVQNTGIDWKKVKLSLSTANPSVNSTAPILTAWHLQFGQPYSVSRRSQMQNNYAANQIQSMPVSDITKAIEGAASGVQATNGGGQPGSDVLVRGRGSLSANTEPLIVLDGAPYDGDMSSINPNDVENMQILKDVSATSMYGARGNNGVILITTKRKTAADYTMEIENELNAVFDIDLPYTITSNNKPQSVTLKEMEQPATYKYYAVPKIDPDAFLLAEVSNYEKLNLLPGEANIIFENMYVGKSYINPRSTNDTLNLSMGRDKKIVVKRERISDMSGTKFMGNNRKQTFTYEIQIRNGKSEKIDLLLKDQYPISTDKDMDIELLQWDNAEINKETGILTWKLNIASGETKKIRLSYSIKYPTSKVIGNL